MLGILHRHLGHMGAVGGIGVGDIGHSSGSIHGAVVLKIPLIGEDAAVGTAPCSQEVHRERGPSTCPIGPQIHRQGAQGTQGPGPSREAHIVPDVPLGWGIVHVVILGTRIPGVYTPR